MLEQFPQIRELAGPTPVTMLFILAIVALQTALAWLLRDRAWWEIVGAAYLVGAFADHALFALMHECAHRLVFRNASANRWASIVANMPQIFPSAISFERYHLQHHACQGVHELDPDMPSRWEARIFGGRAWMKMLWLLLFPIFQLARLSRLRDPLQVDSWLVANVTLQAAFTIAIWHFMGGPAVGYLFLSFVFSIGLHPVGARWIQEHYCFRGGEQETFSYYGPLNKLAFNVGLHNEHHDFPSVAWSKLPRITAIASRHYDTLHAHKSWTVLLLRFLFDREMSLFNRVEREQATITAPAPEGQTRARERHLPENRSRSTAVR